MRRATVAPAAGLAVAGCGQPDPPRDVKDARRQIDTAAQDARAGGRQSVDQADKALMNREDSDLPPDVQKELGEAK